MAVEEDRTLRPERALFFTIINAVTDPILFTTVLDGHITLESTMGVGSTFTLTIPSETEQ